MPEALELYDSKTVGTYAVMENEKEITKGSSFIFCNNVIHRITAIRGPEPMQILKLP